MENDKWHWQESGEAWEGIGLYHITLKIPTCEPLLGDMVSPTDKLSSQHDQDIVKTFYTRYLNYDPFFHQGTLSQPEKTEDIHGNPHPELEYQCTPTELVMVDILNPPDILLGSINQHTKVNGQEKEVYFYHGDHLGSANWITDYTGVPIQYIHYAPYGELIDNQVPYGYDERFKFTGKERDAETGYDFFGARFYWQAGTWLSIDPLAGDYPWISPYAYCAWNPIKYADPDGRKCVVASSIAQKRLLSTLSCSERKYVSFDRNGNINASRLNRCKSTSHNMTALKALTNSKDVTYNFLVQDKSSNGKTDMKKAGGVTEMYGAQRDPSPDPSIVKIISGDHLTGEAAAVNMAHEAFGHAYMYELTGGDTYNASHHEEVDVNKSYIGADGSWNFVFIETNTDLQQHINEAVNEAKKNYDCGL